LWIARINAAVRAEGLTYSEFIHKLNEKGVDLDRKVLADLAMNNPETFKNLVAEVKKFALLERTTTVPYCLYRDGFLFNE
jgi:ribosomal protein L20